MIAIIVTIGVIGCVLVGSIMGRVKTPRYQVIESQGNIEIRRYEPMIIAEVQVEGECKEAMRDGFRLLADYIFGNNTVKQDIAMTTPVQQQESRKLAMTAPVQQQFTNGSWQVSFVMPSDYSMETLPKPSNDRVNLKEIPSTLFVTITFSGANAEKNMKKQESRLMEYVKINTLSVTGSPKYAFYNPPWTLPPMRRNEIMIEIKQ